MYAIAVALSHEVSLEYTRQLRFNWDRFDSDSSQILLWMCLHLFMGQQNNSKKTKKEKHKDGRVSLYLMLLVLETSSIYVCIVYKSEPDIVIKSLRQANCDLSVRR